jgi:hypothetical protein
MTRLITLVSAAAFAVASATAFAQGAGKSTDAPKATPATPAAPAQPAVKPATPATPATPAPAAKADDTKKAAKPKANEPTKAQTRSGDPKGEAKGQTK